jgi:2-phosphosulfolactate phosphatase
VSGESVLAQPGTGVRFDWGVTGAAELARVCAALVLVDVLSFSTSVEVAVARGIRVHPFPWGDQAQAYADRIGAAVAVGRDDVSSRQPYSLSPTALASAPLVSDLVLPSPNGSAISAAAAATGLPVVAGCLRNASAVGRWLRGRSYGTPEAPVGVVAAGEQWPDGQLRPCVEDLLGAAAVIDALADTDALISVEAAVALAALAGVPDIGAAVRGCASGRELSTRGFGADVNLAVDQDCSPVVPRLSGEAFVRDPGLPDVS